MTTRLEKAKDQLKKTQARVQRLDALDKQKKRKDDTRRKILAGAIALTIMEERWQFREWFGGQLRLKLKSERDRSLFF